MMNSKQYPKWLEDMIEEDARLPEHLWSFEEKEAYRIGAIDCYEKALKLGYSLGRHDGKTEKIVKPAIENPEEYLKMLQNGERTGL